MRDFEVILHDKKYIVNGYRVLCDDENRFLVEYYKPSHSSLIVRSSSSSKQTSPSKQISQAPLKSRHGFSRKLATKKQPFNKRKKIIIDNTNDDDESSGSLEASGQLFEVSDVHEVSNVHKQKKNATKNASTTTSDDDDDDVDDNDEHKYSSSEDVQSNYDTEKKHPGDVDGDDTEAKVKFVIKDDYDVRDKFACWSNLRNSLKSSKGFWCYDVNGVEIVNNFSQHIPTFVVVAPYGTILAVDHPGFIMVEFYNPETGINSHAPGHVEEFELDNVDGPQIRLSWLEEDKTVRKKRPRAFDSDGMQSSSLIAKDTHWMPLTSIRLALTLLPTKTKETFMPAYKHSIHEFEAECKCGLMSYSLNQGRIGRDGHVVDVYDILEFFHSPDIILWRTALGTFIYQNFIVHVIEFGGKNRMAMVGAILSSELFDVRIDNTGSRGACQACNKPQVITHTVILSKDLDDTLRVGCVCADRIEYIFNIGKLIREFRGEASLNMARGEILVTQLASLQSDYMITSEQNTLKFGAS